MAQVEQVEHVEPVESCFTVSGTQLERVGRSPLLAVAQTSAGGAVVQAFLVDPEQMPGCGWPNCGCPWFGPCGGAV